MTKHVEIDLDGAAPLTEAGCIAFLTALGYRVTAPKSPKRGTVRNDAIVGYKGAMKSWDRALVHFTFSDGVRAFAYAMRETAGKPWFAAAAARAACNRYRDKSPAAFAYRHRTMGGRGCERTVEGLDGERVACGGYYDEIGPAMVPYRVSGDSVAVPEIVAVEGIELDLQALNEATAKYRAADPDRPRKMLAGTAF